MTDHHQVIQADPGPDAGGAKGGPVDTGICSHLHVIIQANRTDLRFGHMDAGAAVSGKAKAVTADHCPVEEHNPVAKRTVMGDH